jgi:hypothetical protein
MDVCGARASDEFVFACVYVRLYVRARVCVRVCVCVCVQGGVNLRRLSGVVVLISVIYCKLMTSVKSHMPLQTKPGCGSFNQNEESEARACSKRQNLIGVSIFISSSIS